MEGILEGCITPQLCPSCGSTNTGGEFCPKCQYRLGLGSFNVDFFKWSKFETLDGVDIEDDLFAIVQKERNGRFRLRIFDKKRNVALSSTFTVKYLEKLKTRRTAKVLRNTLKARYVDYEKALEQFIIIVEDHTSETQFHTKNEGDGEERDRGFSNERLERAREILRDPAYMYRFGEVFEQGTYVPDIPKPRFVIGEQRTKRLVSHTVTAGAKKGTTRIIRLLGGIGTGKDCLCRITVKLLRPAIKIIERTYMSAAVQRYSDDLQNCDVLYIPDMGGMQGESGRQMRFNRADDPGLKSEYIMKDETTGEMAGKLEVSPGKAILTTTNVIRFDRAAESGAITFLANESPELTKQVQEEQLKFDRSIEP